MNEIEILLEKENGEKTIALESEGTIILPNLEVLEVTPTKEQQVFNHKNSDGYDNVIVNPIPNEYVIPEGTLDVDANGDVDVTMFRMARVGVAPVLQDKSITITENGTQNITADAGYGGLGNVEITTNIEGGSTGEPDYITDGLVAWFDGEDEFNSECKLMNRVGEDYIYVKNHKIMGSSNVIYNPPIKPYGSKSIPNNMVYSYEMSRDYFNNGYTYEVVGRVTSRYNDCGSSGGWLLASNMSGAWGVGLTESSGKLVFVNNSSTNSRTYTGYYNKKFGASVYTEEVFTRDNPSGAVRLQVSVDGDPYHTVVEKSSASRSSNTYGMAVMSYYTTQSNAYRINGEVYCIRIYNRKLTEEEITHNHAIDVERFGLEK